MTPITAARVLADIEAIPETPENYRQVREARRDAQALVEQTHTPGFGDSK